MSRHILIDRVHERTGISKKDIRAAYFGYFRTLRKIFSNGEAPAAVLTGLMSFQISTASLKLKAITLTELILEENLKSIKHRFKVDSLDEARAELTEILRVYKMKKNFDNLNLIAKRRDNNGWET